MDAGSVLVQRFPTYEVPRAYPEGIPYVLVNGKVVVENGKTVPELPGRVLRHGN